MNLEQKIQNSLRGNGIFLTFDGVEWRDKGQALRADPRIVYEDLKLSEISRKDAIQLLISALSNDLCYGAKRLGKGMAEQIAKEFIGAYHEQARFYTNSDVPYNNKSHAWSFSPITEATIDTGVIVREGKNLASLLWVMGID
ncbi:MAG: hypothetical protein PVG66_03340 [Chromatiales bacterium]|jgi:hypothetical protein